MQISQLKEIKTTNYVNFFTVTYVKLTLNHISQKQPSINVSNEAHSNEVMKTNQTPRPLKLEMPWRDIELNLC